MTKLGRKNYKKSELAEMLHDADVRMQVLETALQQIAEEPSDDPATLHQIASTALEKAGEARSPVGLRE
jgi:hypothetical protein